MRNRRLYSVVVLLCVFALWFRDVPPRRPAVLFDAMPADVDIVSYHKDLARDWKAALDNKAVQVLVRRFDGDVENGRGFGIVLYWLTGSPTVLGVKGELGIRNYELGIGGLGRKKGKKEKEGGILGRKIGKKEEEKGELNATLYGASYVGWKTRPMQFLRLVRWVPGLGRMQLSERGTRYIVLKDEFLQENGYVLSLEVYRGCLFMALSQDSDAVVQLVENAKRYNPLSETHRKMSESRTRFYVPEKKMDVELRLHDEHEFVVAIAHSAEDRKAIRGFCDIVRIAMMFVQGVKVQLSPGDERTEIRVYVAEGKR